MEELSEEEMQRNGGACIGDRGGSGSRSTIPLWVNGKAWRTPCDLVLTRIWFSKRVPGIVITIAGSTYGGGTSSKSRNIQINQGRGMHMPRGTEIKVVRDDGQVHRFGDGEGTLLRLMCKGRGSFEFRIN